MTIANQTENQGGRRRKSLRDIVEINENLCDGCGECLPSCAEGALAIEDGRVVLKAEVLCDGLGSCLGSCPKGALTITRRLSDDFIPPESGLRPPEEELTGPSHQAQAKPRAVVSEAPPNPDVPRPAAKEEDLTELIASLERSGGKRPWPGLGQSSEPEPKKPIRADHDLEVGLPGYTFEGDNRSLVSWPIQLALVPPKSSFFNTQTIIVAADCVAFTGPEFHRLFQRQGHPLVIGCPKLDDRELYVAKLGVILRDNPELTELLIPIMEVPCCRGLWRLAKDALARSKRHDVKLLGWIFSSAGKPLMSMVNIMLE
ncbi:MAG: hypothetical protein LBF38_12765 [Deltaproteobacteria bacterium]|jgi:ferredoxin|nr:hypothetical protein [Deltaproteobacteria bacterium]